MKLLTISARDVVRDEIRETIEILRPNKDEFFHEDNLQQAIDILKKKEPDLIFLDITFLDEGKKELLEFFKLSNASIVLAGGESYTSPIFQKYELDYLENSKDQIQMKRLIEKTKAKRAAQLLKSVSKRQTSVMTNKLGVKEKDGIRFIEVEKIVRCQSDSNYTEIHLENGDRVLSSKTLKEYEDLLEPFGFYRIHQSHMVDMKRITKIINKDGLFVQLDDKEVVELSRRRKEGLLNRLQRIG